jgi:hypothetical protein
MVVGICLEPFYLLRGIMGRKCTEPFCLLRGIMGRKCTEPFYLRRGMMGRNMFGAILFTAWHDG